jgi:ubiquinone/menaquinone biosynthesis C-methylase UbiE
MRGNAARQNRKFITIMDDRKLLTEIASYWNEHIHDLAITTHPVGSTGFFQELDEYRFEKLNYLPRLVDFSAYRGKRFLEIGCGAGIDLVRFARAGAVVTGVDLSNIAIQLASQNFDQNNLSANLCVMNGESLEFSEDSFDVVYAHGVLQYTEDAKKMLAEIKRVLIPGGEAIIMVYNKYSWLTLMRYLTGVSLEHEDAPVMKTYSIPQLKQLLNHFSRYRIVPERFPVKTKLHGGKKAVIYNQLFVGTFNLLPKAFIRPFGWHLMAFATK